MDWLKPGQASRPIKDMTTLHVFSAIFAVILVAVNSQEVIKGRWSNVFLLLKKNILFAVIYCSKEIPPQGTVWKGIITDARRSGEKIDFVPLTLEQCDAESIFNSPNWFGTCILMSVLKIWWYIHIIAPSWWFTLFSALVCLTIY